MENFFKNTRHGKTFYFLIYRRQLINSNVEKKIFNPGQLESQKIGKKRIELNTNKAGLINFFTSLFLGRKEKIFTSVYQKIT